MTEEVVVEEKAADPEPSDNNANIDRALRWVVEQSEDGTTCPLCGWRVAFDNRKKGDQLYNHVRQRHLYASIEAHVRGSLDGPKSPDDLDPLAEAGLEVVDSFDEPTALDVPLALRIRYAKQGDALRWVAPDRVQSFKDRGWEFAVAKEGEVEKPNGSTEDSRVRTGELTLMVEPARRHQARMEARERRRRRDFQAARKEDFERKMEGHAGRAYDAAMRAGWGRDRARALGSAIERGLTEGTITIKR